MDSIRKAFGWWNEVGLIVGFLLSIGYFGSRQAGGWLPMLCLVVYLIGGLWLVLMAANRGGAEEPGVGASGLSRLDKSLLYVLSFVFGTAVFTQLGALL